MCVLRGRDRLAAVSLSLGALGGELLTDRPPDPLRARVAVRQLVVDLVDERLFHRYRDVVPVFHTYVLSWCLNKYWADNTDTFTGTWYHTTVIKWYPLYNWAVGMTDDDRRSSPLSARVSLAISESLNAAIEAELESDDSKSEWIREACREQLDREQAVESPQK